LTSFHGICQRTPFFMSKQLVIFRQLLKNNDHMT